MKTTPRTLFLLPAVLALSIALSSLGLRAQTGLPTNSVTPMGTNAFVINGLPNPSLTLERGVTYVFQVNATFHPFYIKTNLTTGAIDQYTNGVTGNGVDSGSLTFVVPTNAPDLLRYHCGNHAPMGGDLNIIDATGGGPTPPNVKIVFIGVTATHVMIQSTGASNWLAIPEFNSNLTMNAWSAVPGYTNNFDGATNTTGFDRAGIDAICGPDVFFRVRNQSN